MKGMQEYLHIKTGGKLYNIPFSKVRRIEARRSSCVIYFDDWETDLIVHTHDMKEVHDEITNPDIFVKIHRSHIVNMHKVKFYDTKKKQVEMEFIKTDLNLPEGKQKITVNEFVPVSPEGRKRYLAFNKSH